MRAYCSRLCSILLQSRQVRRAPPAGLADGVAPYWRATAAVSLIFLLENIQLGKVTPWPCPVEAFLILTGGFRRGEKEVVWLAASRLVRLYCT